MGGASFGFYDVKERNLSYHNVDIDQIAGFVNYGSLI